LASNGTGLAKARADGLCHYVGTYYTVKVLVVCLQKKKSFCCFHSVLGRIVQEQSRATQGLPYKDWGNSKSPICWGFTPGQFQAADWSKINLGEYYSYIEQDVLPQATQNANDAVHQAEQKLQKPK
jgi:conjugal transfer mating pair stabilization protein TraN